MMKDKEKTAEILKRIKLNHSYNKTDIVFPELRIGTGFSGHSERRIDVFVISSNGGNLTTGYEIKASRGDFIKELKNEIKQRGARVYCNEFYYACPKDMIKPEEVPVWAGLIEFDLSRPVTEYRRYADIYIKKVVPAPILNKENPSWGLIASMVRKINRELA